MADVQEMSGEDSKTRLEMSYTELESISQRINDNNSRFKGN